MQNGKIPTDELEPISGNKILRDNFLHGNGAKSYYSYEDLPSNKFANTIDCNQPDTITEYGVIDGKAKEGEELFKAIESKFVNAKATNPESAPNWKKIPEKEDRNVLYDEDGNVRELKTAELNTGKYVPQNHSSKPYKLDNFPAAPTSLEKENKKDKKR
jgi:hypothetical protein